MNPAWIQAGAQFAGNVVNSLFQRGTQKREFEQNKRMADYAYGQQLDMWNRQNDWNRSMWNLQNEYNLPANQMQRLRDAGLNPNLIYGNAAAGGQAAAIQKAEMPKYSPARANYTHLPIQTPDVLGMYQDYRLRSAQIDNVKAATDLAKAREMTEGDMRDPKVREAWNRFYLAKSQATYADLVNEAKWRQEEKKLENLLLDWKIKSEMIGKTRAEKGIKQAELGWMTGFSGARPQDLTRFVEQLLRMALSRR